VSGLLIGYTRVSTDAQDLTAQRDALERAASTWSAPSSDATFMAVTIPVTAIVAVLSVIFRDELRHR
jgi:Resolvase, N terminal domain